MFVTANTELRTALLLSVAMGCLMMGCDGGSVKVPKHEGVEMKLAQSQQMLVPLDVPVANANDKWWFYDNFTFVGRIHRIGNIVLAAEIGRCLDPGSSTPVTKTFRCKLYDGSKWSEVLSYTEPDVITEMKTISTNPRMDFSWRKPQDSGVLKCLSLGGAWIVTEFTELKPYYSFGDSASFKRSYGSGLGRLDLGDSVVQGQMFYEMINVRGNDPCTGEMPSFRPDNLCRIFAQTSAGKTVIASIDLGNPSNPTHNCFFTVCDVEVCKMAEGCALISGENKLFERDDRFGGFVPQFVSIYSGDAINVQLDLWIERDKDAWDQLGDGWMRSGGFGNAVFWNRREKAWGLIDRFQAEKTDTLVMRGAIRRGPGALRP